ncbi:MAG: hypothetical protein JSW23_08505 [Planctomycetota bacterium]|nr:MAG: hypothetical protein JSW23_08505 [Planctomycetota bacterium]
MEEDEEQTSPGTYTVLLVISAIAIYVGGIFFLFGPMALMIDLMPRWFRGPAGALIILGFDIVWIIAMRKRASRDEESKQRKMILSLFVLPLSMSALTCWLIIRVLLGWH